MDFEQEQKLIAEIKKYVSEHLSLSQISDEELEERINDIVVDRIGDQYCPIDQRVSIVQQDTVLFAVSGFWIRS